MLFGEEFVTFLSENEWAEMSGPENCPWFPNHLWFLVSGFWSLVSGLYPCHPAADLA